MAPAKKVVIYIRTSTPEQAPENQLPALQKWIADRDYQLLEVYRETESAWSQGYQKELARLFTDLKKRKVEVCLIWVLDRLTREGIAKIFELINKFKQHNVQVISLQELWTESTGHMTDLLYAITAWVAEFESKRRSERTKAGLARAVSEGKQLGRPKGATDKRKRKRTGYLLRYAA